MTVDKAAVRVSVILTTYNSGKTLQRALDSVLSQEGIGEAFDLELIVVDDCSTDNTHEILKKNNVGFIVNEKNSGGPNKGRNIGLSAVTGDYICIMDHDDEWFPVRLKKLLSVCHLAPVVTSGQTVIYQKTNRSVERLNQTNNASGVIVYEPNVTFLSTLSRSSKGQNSYIGSVLFHKSLQHLRFEEYFGKIDYDWGLQLLKGNTTVEICESLYKRYVDDVNLSLNSVYRTLDFYYSLMILDGYSDEYPKQTLQGVKRLYGTRARFYYLHDNMPKARYNFLKSGLNLKNLLYYLTTFVGSRYVKKKFTFFG